jgi:hypothetical protein
VPGPRSFCALKPVVGVFLAKAHGNVRAKRRKFWSRTSTLATLARLELTFDDADGILLSLTTRNYCECLESEDDRIGVAWVFGTMYAGQGLYIKLQTRCAPTGEEWTVCMSFHIAERSLQYPYASQEPWEREGA